MANSKVFKHSRGYIIYTSDKIYLTTTGNWSEVKELQEKTKNTYEQNKNRLRKKQISASVISVISCSILYCILPLIVFIPIALIAIPILIATIEKIFQTDYSNLICIPTLKVKNISYSQKELIISFINGDNLDDSVRLSELDKEFFINIHKLSKASPLSCIEG